MSPWDLPSSLRVGEEEYAIRTDYRVALYLLGIFADPEYEPDERAAICLRVLYRDWESIPPEQYQQALEQAAAFLDGALPPAGRRTGPRLMDWEQDGAMIVSAVNRVMGRDVRAEPLHWWTFLAAYMEIGEGLFATVLDIRRKRAKGGKLEKYEAEFLRENRPLVELRRRDTAAERARRQELDKLFV